MRTFFKFSPTLSSLLFIAGALLVNLFAPPVVSAQSSKEAIAASGSVDNFEKVSTVLWRGAVPSQQALKQLKESGIHTVVDLRMDCPGIYKESQSAEQLGISYVHIPFGFNEPSPAKILEFMSIVTDPKNQPIFVHCRQGADRTGTLVAIYRRIIDGWTFEQAYGEMRTHHFKPWLLSMRKSVENLPCDQFRELLANSGDQKPVMSRSAAAQIPTPL